MGGSLRIARVRGIDIKVHWSFIFILAYGAFAWAQIAAQQNPADGNALLRGALYGVLLILTLFVFVVLHELGHSVAAQAFHIPVRDITLLPLGGVARLERLPEKPWQEFVVAIAGPTVNFLLALLLAPLLALALVMGDVTSLREVLRTYTEVSLLGFVTYVTLTNVLLGLFNLLPAFPMDGGRILRSLLAMVVNPVAATQAAVIVGRGLAIIMGIWALTQGDIFLILIAAFIFFGAGQEGNEVKLREALKEVPASASYNRQGIVLGAAQQVSDVVGTMMTSNQAEFAVLVGSQMIGVVTRDRVVAALRQGRTHASVGEVMDRNVLKVSPETSLYDVRLKMAEAGKQVAAVFDGPAYLGLVSLSDISEAYLLMSATSKRKPAQSDAPKSALEYGRPAPRKD